MKREESSISSLSPCLSCLWCNLTFWKGWKKMRDENLSCHSPAFLSNSSSFSSRIIFNLWNMNMCRNVPNIHFFMYIMMTFKVKRWWWWGGDEIFKYNLGWWVSDNGRDGKNLKRFNCLKIYNFLRREVSSWNKKSFCCVKEDWVTLMACKNENRFLSSGNNDSRHLLFPSWHWEKILVKTESLLLFE